MTGKTRYLRACAVVAALALLAGSYYAGVFDRVADPRALAQTLRDAGAWGYAAFILSYTFLQPFGVPGTVFIVAAPLIWPWQTAFALSLVGTMAASVVGFSFARIVAKSWLAGRIPARLRKYDQALATRGFQTVVLLRLILWMPQALHAFFGVSQVPFWTHFWGSLLGYIPPLLLVSFLGGEMFDASGALQPAALPVLAGLLVASLLIVALMRAYERCRLAAQAPRGA